MYTIEHPLLLIIALIACAPALFPLARFFFTDLESFLDETGLSTSWGRWMWLLGAVPRHPQLSWKLTGFIGTFGILVWAVYATAARMLF